MNRLDRTFWIDDVSQLTIIRDCRHLRRFMLEHPDKPLYFKDRDPSWDRTMGIKPPEGGWGTITLPDSFDAVFNSTIANGTVYSV